MTLPSVIWFWVWIHKSQTRTLCTHNLHPIDNDERPPWPNSSKYVTPQLQDLVRACWDQDPTKRPSFADIVPLTQIIRETTPLLTEDFTPSYISELPELGIEDPVSSPDIRPVLLPIEELSCMRPAYIAFVSSPNIP